MPLKWLKTLLAATLLALAIPPATAAIWQGANADQPAVSGHDPVAYFTTGTATPGLPTLTYTHDGAIYRFSTPENRTAFIQNPGKYAPQFGGHCAWAASQNRLAGPDPKIWRIEGGKLYLNCSKEAEAKWLADIPGNIAKAETFWEFNEDPGNEP